MGMYDELKCLYPLPLTKELKELSIEWKEINWQTKSFDSDLGQYTISKSGKLTIDKIKGDWLELPKEQQYKWSSHEFVETSRHKTPVKYHGIVNFYSFEVLDNNDGWWFEFEAYFSYGKLDKIKLRETRKEENYKIISEQNMQELFEQYNTPTAKLKTFIRKWGWRHLWNYITKILRYISRRIDRTIAFINRNII
mgnify:CR=1 FL=1|tara:strand:- start:39 stop:623 length:585 start_codon:yes stop_codon:yes gene_type:complete